MIPSHLPKHSFRPPQQTADWWISPVEHAATNRKSALAAAPYDLRLPLLAWQWDNPQPHQDCEDDHHDKRNDRPDSYLQPQDLPKHKAQGLIGLAGLIDMYDPHESRCAALRAVDGVSFAP